jgi:hypothetical protein
MLDECAPPAADVEYTITRLRADRRDREVDLSLDGGLERFVLALENRLRVASVRRTTRERTKRAARPMAASLDPISTVNLSEPGNPGGTGFRPAYLATRMDATSRSGE